MANSDLRQVIIDYLSTPQTIVSDEPVPGMTGWHKLQYGGGMGAKAETVRFVKERSLPRRQVHFVTFKDEEEREMHFACSVTQDEQGEWKFRGSAGGGGGGKIVREQPWANLAGSWPYDFYAGGYVIDNGLDVVRVRLTASNGVVMEDSVDDGIVLFLSDQMVEVP